MNNSDKVIAVFDAHSCVIEAIKSLTSASFTMMQLSIIGRGYHTDDNFIGFYTTSGGATHSAPPRNVPVGV